MLFNSFLFCSVICISAVIVDRLCGEPKRWHPIVGLGLLISWMERHFRLDVSDETKTKHNYLAGLLAVILLVLTALFVFSVISIYMQSMFLLNLLMHAFIVYICIAPRSLEEHAQAIIKPLALNDLPEARLALANIVSRDCQDLNEKDIATATCESLLENGSDGVFAALFWYLIAGLPGIVVYRVANTLDAMWGYRTERYQYFGWSAAKLDDLLNYLPARLVALSYALVGNFTTAMRCWSDQGADWKSPNAGPVMAAGAGSLEVMLGGEAMYHGEPQRRPILGCGRVANTEDISRVINLIRRALYLWLFVAFLLGLFAGASH